MTDRVPFWRRRPVATAATESDAPREQASVPERLLSLVLPVAVLVLVGVWFCTIPAYAPKPLPENWRPAGEAWPAEWHTTPVVDSIWRSMTWANSTLSDGRFYAAGELAGSGEAVLRRLDPVTGELLAESPGLPSASAIECARGLLITPGVLAFPADPLPILDPLTLQVVDLVTFRVPDDATFELPPQAYVEFCALPDGRWAGIGRDKSGSMRQIRWFRADASGLIEDCRAITRASARWTLRETADGPAFVQSRRTGPIFPKTSPGNPATPTVTSIDAMTGTALDLPAEEEEMLAGPTGFGSLREHAALPAGWQEVRPTLILPSGPYIASFTLPMALMDRSDTLMSNFGAPRRVELSRSYLTHQFALARGWCWEQRYSEEALLAARQRTVRPLAIGLTFDAEHEIRLAESEMPAFRADAPVWERHDNTQQPSTATGMPHYSTEIRIALSVRKLSDGRLLILHRLQHPPATLADGPILRLGLASPERDTIEWLGWVPWPTGQPAELIEGMYRHPIIGRLGDRLMISFIGSVPNPKIKKSMLPSDFTWLSVPLPATCANLPEGPWL